MERKPTPAPAWNGEAVNTMLAALTLELHELGVHFHGHIAHEAQRAYRNHLREMQRDLEALADAAHSITAWTHRQSSCEQDAGDEIDIPRWL